MAIFTITIETPAREHPANRSDEIAERGRLQQLLLTVVSSISNCGVLTGEAAGVHGGRARYRYEVHQDV